jgi:FAD/FMN-containing dehydrogenase
MDQVMDSLRSDLSGSVITPEDETYDMFRQTMFNHAAKPAIIALCKTVDDVVRAVNFARDNHMKLSVRSGGHSGAGLSTNDGGIVIDLRDLHQVKVLDENKGIVRIEAGAKWGDVANALESHNLVVSSGDTRSVGVGGLVLGGGIGWMIRTYGLSIDRLEAVELVSATGEKIRATATENVDLFWAVRGGGGNFGVATAFEFRAIPCEGVVGGKLIFDAADAEVVLTKWSAYMRTAPKKLNSTVVLFPGFGPDAKPQVIVAACYADHDEVAARQALQPLRELAPVIHDDIKVMAYAEMLEDVKDVSALKIRVRNGFVQTLTPGLVQVLAKNFAKPGTPMLQIRSLGAALSDISTDATAFEHRDTEALLVMNAMLPRVMSDEQVEEAADTAWNPIKPFVHGAYIGFQTDNSERSTDEAYDVNRERLMRVKAAYDPQNIFDQNTNIKPAN